MSTPSRGRPHRRALLLGLVVVVLLSISGAAASQFPRVSVAEPITSAAHTPWSVVALGDSVTSGAECECTAFPTLYGQALAARYHRKVDVVNAGVDGTTSDDLLASLQAAPQAGSVPGEVSAANVVVITIGANDFGAQHDAVEEGTCGSNVDILACARPGLAHLADNLEAILSRIQVLRGGHRTAILVTGYWNVFEDGDVAVQQLPPPGHATSQDLTLAINQVEQGVAGGQRATYVDLYSPFVGVDGRANPTKLLAADGDHPNAAGHQVIADALLAAGVAPLRVS